MSVSGEGTVKFGFTYDLLDKMGASIQKLIDFYAVAEACYGRFTR